MGSGLVNSLDLLNKICEFARMCVRVRVYGGGPASQWYKPKLWKTQTMHAFSMLLLSSRVMAISRRKGIKMPIWTMNVSLSYSHILLLSKYEKQLCCQWVNWNKYIYMLFISHTHFNTIIFYVWLTFTMRMNTNNSNIR